MRKNFLFTILACVLFVIAPFKSLEAQKEKEDEKKVVATAVSGLHEWLEKVPKGKESLYGFNSRAELDMATVGKPYQVKTLSKDFFSDKGLAAKDYIIPTGEWRIAVTVNGEYRTLLTIAPMNGAWQIVDFGGGGLARELGEFEKKHPSAHQVGFLLKVYQLQSDFVILNTNEQASSMQVFPLTSANKALGAKDIGSNFYSFSELLPLIKKKIEHK